MDDLGGKTPIFENIHLEFRKKKTEKIREISNRTHGPRTPKKPEYLIAWSQLTDRGPLGFGPIQVFIEKSDALKKWGNAVQNYNETGVIKLFHTFPCLFSKKICKSNTSPRWKKRWEREMTSLPFVFSASFHANWYSSFREATRCRCFTIHLQKY